MVEQKGYYEILINNNELAIVAKIDNDTYNYFKDTFESIYHTKNGEEYKIDETTSDSIDILIVDNENLHNLLNDLLEQGFCDEIKFYFGYGWYGGE